MKIRNAAVFAAAALTAFSGVRAAEMVDAAPQLPRKAMPFGIQTGPEKYTWLSEFEGKTCVVAFILTTCPHCQFTTGILNRLHTEFAGKGVVFIASAAEPMASLHISDFNAKFHPAFPVGYNDQRYIAQFLGYPEDAPLMFPTIAIIDPHGIIRSQLSGDDKLMNKEIQEKSLREAIEKTMASGQAARAKPAPK